MGGDAFRKVIAGSPLQISARAWSVLMEMAQWYLSARSSGAGLGGVNQSAGIVSVRNDTGGDLDRFSVVGVSEPIIGSTDHLQRFKNRVTLVGEEPGDPEHWGRIAVLQEPVADGKIGRAVVSGITVVKVSSYDGNHGFADIDDGQTGHLKSCCLGSARIIWKQSGVSARTPGWAVVLLGDSAERGVWVEITDQTDLGDNRWSYTFAEVRKGGNGYGQWTQVTQGISGTAFNSYEDMNDGAGTEGNGIDVDGFTTAAYLPVPIGTIAWVKAVVRASTWTLEWWFHFVNETTWAEGTSSSSSSSG